MFKLGKVCLILWDVLGRLKTGLKDLKQSLALAIILEDWVLICKHCESK